MNTLQQLKPKKLWRIFHELTQIPRPSKKEAKVVEFVRNFGLKLGLETKVDKTGNVVIKKPAVPGMEDRMGVILQAHLDMVPQKNSDKIHDFEKDPIETVIDGGWVRANGTTLGADNGIGVAAALAVIEANDIKHGPLEVLLTVDEETGMTGAFGLEKGMLDGNILLNLDSEDEGELFIGCAGGLNTSGYMTYKEIPVQGDMKAYSVSVTGLKGGHSGTDIHLCRGNANKIMIKFLCHGTRNLEMRISSIEGGNLRNAIPRESFAVVVVPSQKVSEFEAAVLKYEKIFKNEFSITDPELRFKAVPSEMPLKVMDIADQIRLIRTVDALPNGVMRMSAEIAGVTETSLNIAVVKARNGEAEILCLLRSSIDSAKLSVANMTQSVMELGGMNVKHNGDYPGWMPNPGSRILLIMKQIYENKYGNSPEIKVVHAGLECGIIGSVYPDLDMVSFGPTIKSPHSPDERVHIESVAKFWDYLLDILKEVPLK